MLFVDFDDIFEFKCSCCILFGVFDDDEVVMFDEEEDFDVFY